MGVVWKARSTALDVEVAVKLVRSSPNPSADAFKRMAREAHAAAKLGHPAMATVLDFGATSSGDPFVVMELLHDSGLVRSMDIVELNPFLDDRGQTARLAVELAGSLFGQQITDRQTPSNAIGAA